MATQLVTCQQTIRCQKLMQSAAYGERGSNFSLSHCQNYRYHRIGNGTQPESNFIEQIERGKGAKGSRKAGHRQAQKLHQYLGISYHKSFFHYILRKVKAYYNGFLGEVANESSMGNEAPMVEPYFSIPVLPNTSSPPIF